MSLLQNSNAISAGGYDINNSLRFRASASAYLNRTFGSTYTDKTKSTVSFWVKRGRLNVTNGHSIMWYNASGASGHITFAGAGAGGSLVNDCLYIGNRNATTGSGDYGLQTTQLFRDPSAWYHIMVVYDTGQATSSNRVKLYVNGTQVTAFVSTQYPSQNYQTTAFLGGNSTAHIIGYGATTGATEYFDGYLAEMHFVDGQALTPSSFGETDTTTGSWVAKKYTGTYGTNGFYLKFANDSNSLSAQYGAFLNGSTQHVSLTPTSAFNFSNNNWTIESFIWPNSQTTQVIFNYGYEGSTNRSMVIYYNGGNLNLAYSTNGSNNTDTSFGAHNMSLNTWYHVAIVRNGTTITAYVNGIPLPTTITIGTSSINYPGTSGAFRIGRDSTNYLNAFIHGFRIVNGTAVYTSKFKPTTTKLTAITNTQLLTLQDATLIDNSTNNFTLTNNGSFTLDFGVVPYAAPSIASDYSENYNNWLIGPGWNVNDISDQSYSVMYDSPTLTSATVANYAVMSPLDFASASGTLSAANLNWASSTNVCGNKSTIGATSGKWYWEAVGSSVTSGTIGGRFGFTGSDTIAAEQDKFGMYWHPTSGIARIVNGTNTYVTSSYTYTNSDVLALALDLDNNISYWYKNGVLQYTYDFSSYSTIGARVFHAYVWNASSGTPSWVYNFGQRPFKYIPRTNHVALNTYNLPDSTIKKGNVYMDATIYSGNSTNNRSIVNDASFRPDLVWIKPRNNPDVHQLYDSVRGAGNNSELQSNSTAAEGGNNSEVYGYMSAFTSTGFTVTAGTDSTFPYALVNMSGRTYVGWQWQAGSSTVTNTSGSISAQVRANTTAGFSIVTYTGNGTAGATVGHGLGVAPVFVIWKNRSVAGTAWLVQGNNIGNPTDGYHLTLHTTNQRFQSTDNNNTFGSTTITLDYADSQNGNGNSMVAYCWAEIAGFSKFGSYTGNGSADGSFIYTGFIPKFIIIKCTDTAGTAWVLYDTARDTYNQMTNILLPNATNAELSGYSLDVLSNGFKHRQGGGDPNATGRNYIYACFASNPFKNANAR